MIPGYKEAGRLFLLINPGIRRLGGSLPTMITRV